MPGQHGPVGQVHGAPTGQAPPDLLAHQRRQRRHDLGEHPQHGGQGVEGGRLAVGEALARGAQVPVGEHVEEVADRGAGPGDVVAVHLGGHRLGQVLGAGQDVAVHDVQAAVLGEQARVVQVDAARDVAGLTHLARVEGEEVPGVPQRQHHLAHGVADGLVGDHEVASAHDRRREQEPAHGVGPVAVEDHGDVRVVAQRLAHLRPVVTQEDAVGDAGGEGGPVEQGGGQDVEGVEPAAGLADVLHDEVARIVRLEPLDVLEGVVHLGEGHGAGLEPTVQDVGDAAHHGLTRGVVGVGPHEGVDEGAVQVGDLDTEVALQLGVGAVDVGARVVGVVADPHRDGRAPEAVARDRPVARVRQPLAEDAVLDVAGVPVDVLVELDHAVADRRDAHEPGGDGLVDERLAAAPAVRVGVHVGGLAHQDGAPALVAAGQGAGAVAQVGNDGLVGLEDLQPGVVADLLGQAAAVVDGHDRLDAGLGAGDHVVLTEGRGHVHQAGSVGGGHEVGGDDRPGIRPRGGALGTVGGVVEVVEDRVVAPPHQVGPGAGGQHLRVLTELAGVGAQQVLRDNDVLASHRRVEVLVDVDGHVLDVGPHGDGHVGGQRPGGGGPDEDQLGALGALAQRLLQA